MQCSEEISNMTYQAGVGRAPRTVCRVKYIVIGLHLGKAGVFWGFFFFFSMFGCFLQIPDCDNWLVGFVGR